MSLLGFALEHVVNGKGKKKGDSRQRSGKMDSNLLCYRSRSPPPNIKKKKIKTIYEKSQLLIIYSCQLCEATVQRGSRLQHIPLCTSQLILNQADEVFLKLKISSLLCCRKPSLTDPSSPKFPSFLHCPHRTKWRAASWVEHGEILGQTFFFLAKNTDWANPPHFVHLSWFCQIVFIKQKKKKVLKKIKMVHMNIF